MQTMNIRQWIGRAVLLAGALLACLLLPAAHAVDFLDPEDAFKFSAAISDDGRTSRHASASPTAITCTASASASPRAMAHNLVPRSIRPARSSSTKPSTGSLRSIAAT